MQNLENQHEVLWKSFLAYYKTKPDQDEAHNLLYEDVRALIKSTPIENVKKALKLVMSECKFLPKPNVIESAIKNASHEKKEFGKYDMHDFEKREKELTIKFWEGNKELFEGKIEISYDLFLKTLKESDFKKVKNEWIVYVSRDADIVAKNIGKKVILK